jgi:hypothetical protein
VVVGHIARWRRDEEASGPARVARHRTIRAWLGVIRLSARNPPVRCTAELSRTRSSGAAVRRRARRQRRRSASEGPRGARRAKPASRTSRSRWAVRQTAASWLTSRPRHPLDVQLTSRESAGTSILATTLTANSDRPLLKEDDDRHASREGTYSASSTHIWWRCC